MRKLECQRCGTPMRFGLQERFQMGQHSLLLGDWPHVLAGSLELEVYFCPECGKVEFFVPEHSERTTSEQLPQKKCPRCGKMHDFDYPKCPYCSFDYYAK